MQVPAGLDPMHKVVQRKPIPVGLRIQVAAADQSAFHVDSQMTQIDS